MKSAVMENCTPSIFISKYKYYDSNLSIISIKKFEMLSFVF